MNSANPLRILMVCTRYLPDLGGVETHTFEVARRLSARDDLAITVLATDRTRSLPPHEVLDGITVFRVPAWPRERDFYLAPQIAAITGQRDRWDLVHCQGIHNAVPVLAMLAARRAGHPVYGDLPHGWTFTVVSQCHAIDAVAADRIALAECCNPGGSEPLRGRHIDPASQTG